MAAKKTEPAQPVAARVGPCTVASCVWTCTGFAYTGTKNGFPTCVCGHTQHVHQKGTST